MGIRHRLSRRSALRGAAAGTALGMAGRPAFGFAQGASPVASPVANTGTPLWEVAAGNGLTYGTSLATWQADDPDYLAVVNREAAILFTEDDLLFWRLKPSPDAALDFQYADRFYEIAESQGQLVLGAHLVWDEGFGEGWTEDDIWGLDEAAARTLMLDTINSVVGRYMGRTAAWIVVNEIIDAHEEDGLRTDYPWTNTIGKSVATEAFVAAHEADPDALLILNEFGFETDSEWDAAADKRAKALIVIDNLLEAGAPVQALGVQAHLSAGDFAAHFDAAATTDSSAKSPSRGLKILITEMDALDDGLPADVAVRDAAIADAYGSISMPHSRNRPWPP